MNAAEYVEQRLAGKSVSELASAMRISERQCLRRYQATIRAMLTKERFLELLAQGYGEVIIAHAHGYERKTLWRKKLSWGLPAKARHVRPLQQTDVCASKPDIQTRWGTAKWLQGYYRLPLKHSNPLWNSPLRRPGQAFVLLHRVVALQKAIDDGNEEFLERDLRGCMGLKAGISVHHIDGDRANCSPENLLLMTSQGHIKRHWHNEVAGRLMDENRKQPTR